MATARIRNDSWKENNELPEVIKLYIKRNFKRSELLDVMKRDFPDYGWSPSSLDRRMRHFGIWYTDRTVTVDQVQSAVREEIEGPGKLLGYRALHKKVRMVHGLCVPRRAVHCAMYVEDPELLEARLPIFKKKKEKQNFVSPGPNFVHSLDGHDKLMGYQNSTYPIAVYGCIDTCSRKMLWIKIWSSNSDPLLIGKFYVEYLFNSKKIAHHLRIDKGTETGIMATIHCYLHKERFDEDAINTVHYGPSTSNQIERWWKELHEKLEKYYKEKLAWLKANQHYDPHNELHRNILSYIMVPVIQYQANLFVELWNNHRIRAQRGTILPEGIPNHIYEFPEKYGVEEHGFEVTEEQLRDVLDASHLLDQENETKLRDYIPQDVRDRCETLRTIDPSDKDLDIVETYLFLTNNFEY